MATIAPPPALKDFDGRNGRSIPERGFGGGGDNIPPRPAFPLHRYRTGIWFALAPITMLFMAFSSAYVVRQGLSDDWQAMALPSLVWWNSLVLVASSMTMELARRKAGSVPGAPPQPSGARVQIFPRLASVRKWLLATLSLGTLFLIGQVVIWRQLALQGIYLATNPGSSFFYLLTAAHGLHLLGGVAGLGWATAATWRRLTPAGRTGVGVAAVYWHFMDALWIYILVLLVIAR